MIGSTQSHSALFIPRIVNPRQRKRDWFQDRPPTSLSVRHYCTLLPIFIRRGVYQTYIVSINGYWEPIIYARCKPSSQRSRTLSRHARITFQRMNCVSAVSYLDPFALNSKAVGAKLKAQTTSRSSNKRQNSRS